MSTHTPLTLTLPFLPSITTDVVLSAGKSPCAESSNFSIIISLFAGVSGIPASSKICPISLDLSILCILSSKALIVFFPSGYSLAKARWLSRLKLINSSYSCCSSSKLPDALPRIKRSTLSLGIWASPFTAVSCILPCASGNSSISKPRSWLRAFSSSSGPHPPGLPVLPPARQFFSSSVKSFPTFG